MNKRIFRIVLDDGTFKDCLITKYTGINIPMSKSKVALHLDKIGEEEYLLLVNDEIVPEGKRINKIEIIRED